MNKKIIVICAFFIFVIVFLAKNNFKPLEKIVCSIRGLTFVEQLGNNAAPGVSGCLKYYKDGGKSCSRPSQCDSGRCVIDGVPINASTLDIDNKIGQCGMGEMPASGETRINEKGQIEHGPLF